MHAALEPLTRLLVQAVVVVGLARSLGLVARGINQPLVIAEVVAGIALGPSLLGWLAPGVSEVLFPAASLGTLGLMSQLGLILFMFLVGLELDPGLLRGRGSASVAISHSSIIVPFALGAVLSLYLYPRLSEPSVTLTSFALFMGVAMSITAFPVLARILVERRLMRTHIGSVTITCAAVDDVTAWCILAFVVSVARAKGMAGAIVTTSLAVAYILVMLFVVRPLLLRLSELSRTREVLSQNRIAVVLVLVLLSATATELIGIHALFGAFILGAVIPKADGFARLLAEKLEDLVVVLLLPLFFAYSGLRTQIGLLTTGWDWAMCALIIAIACLGKFGGSAIAARLTGLRWREASALGILMNTRGLMELVVLNIGLDLGVISSKLFTMMVLMALVTTFMTSPLLEMIYPLSELTRDLGKEPDAEPALAAPVESMVLCVSDPSSGPGMVRLAAALGGKNVFALQLVRPSGRSSLVMAESEEGEHERPAPLGPLFDTAQELAVEINPISFVSAQPAQDICGVAVAKHANLVLLGWHKPLLGHAALGGVVREVLEQAPVDVGILVDRGLARIRKVLVPYIGGEHDAASLRIAQRLAHQSGVEVTVLHVVPPRKSPRGALEQRMVELSEPTEQGDTRVVMQTVESDDPPEAAVKESRNGYDLVVIGAGAAWRLEQRLVSMQAEYVLRHCKVSLLVMRNGDELRTAAAVRETDSAREESPAAALPSGVARTP